MIPEKKINAILQDVRDDNTRLIIDDRKEWETAPEKRIEVYDKNTGKRKYGKPDAERWPIAIASYKKYDCFSFCDKENAGHYYFNDNIIDSYVWYIKKDGSKIRLSADLLTNVDAIRKMLKSYKDELTEYDNKIVKAFYYASYTMGNFCLIWRNPNGNPSSIDTCWSKLRKSGLYDISNNALVTHGTNLENRKVKTNLLQRKVENLFMILSDKEDPKDIMRDLYFQDYFNYQWRIKFNYENLANVADMGKESLIEMIKDITILIIQRGYRIVTGYKGNVFYEEQKNEIKEILRRIGMDNVECIYSKKGKILVNEIDE